MLRRALVSLTAITAAFTLVAACGSDEKAATTSQAAQTTAAAATAASSPATTATSASPGSASSAPATAAAGSAAPANDAAWNNVVEQAKAEKKVTMYSVMVPDINDRLTAAFKKAHPDIDLEIIRVPGNEIDAKLDAEAQSGAAGADVVANVNYPWVQTALDGGKLAELTGPNATGPGWAGTPYLIDNKVQQSTFTNIGLGWNTGAFPDGGPKSYEDLLDPKYGGGKIGLPDPIAAVVADFYATLQDNYGADVLTKLAAQKPVFFPGAVPLEQSMASGEITVGGYVTNIGIQAAKGQGAPVEFAAPDKAWVPPIQTYIPTWVKHPNAAQVLVDFMASTDGQTVLGKDSYSPLPNIPGTVGPIENASVADVKRITTPGWYDQYYATWKQTFGR